MCDTVCFKCLSMLLADSPVGLLVSRNDYPWTDDEPRLCHEECLTDYTLILARIYSGALAGDVSKL